MPRKSNDFAETVTEDDSVIATPAPTASSGLVQARIKGTWTMYYGNVVYNFIDGKSFNIPKDLYAYLKKNSNIYDTL